MQNRKFFTSLTAVFALAAGLASCSNNYEELDSQNVDGRTPITLTSNVTTRAASQDLQNKQIADKVNVGVFVTNNDVLTDVDNHLLTANGAGGFTGAPMYFPEDAEEVNIYAYAPRQDTWAGKLTENNTFTVLTDQSKDADYCKSDLMIADKVSIAPTGNAINLTFKHKLAKLNLDFDLGDSNIDLKGATISILNVLPDVPVNVSTGVIGTAAGAATTITAAKFATEAATFKASVVFAPQTISGAVEFVEVVTANSSQTFRAKLPQDVTFDSGKKYTYTVKFSGEGGSTEVELVAGSKVEDWEDGMLDQYTIGDYVTKDGQILKPNAVSEENKANIVAVIFSKEISEKDVTAGYNAYAMDLEAITAQFDDPFASDPTGTVKVPVTGESITKYIDALNDLDGLTKTQDAIDWYSANEKTIPSASIFNQLGSSAPISNMLCSNWFVPSFGQMVQFLNGIGDAGITEDLTVSEAPSAPYYTQTDGTSLYTKFSDCARQANKSDFIVKSGVYVTITEAQWTYNSATNVNFWCFQTYADNSWSFGRNPGKGGNNRKLLRCVALKLPTSSAPISAAQAQ